MADLKKIRVAQHEPSVSTFEEKDHGYNKSIPRATPMLTAKHKEKRVEWATNHLNRDWSKTLFSDETAF